ncbi:hypothetical protein NEOLEDRAFT_1147000 [Neolentinus lepideus HHB14362 ss-1]|uniref:Uncharacterized protein n=1 Tax=Neolentinus lepideus HHB14362 ss-1 TaxID=1314782 RepID=A0A165TI68_9AGAM|nr:hypothetical protein NEOLEDRAFT_1147000 [Neolentinus lepideus HHB14362 ss-1]
MSYTSLRGSSLTIPSLESLRRSSLSSSSSSSTGSISTSRSGSQIWDSCASDSQADLTDNTPPPTPTDDDLKSALEAALETPITFDEDDGPALVPPHNTPVLTVDHGDAGYEAEAEEYHHLTRAPRRARAGHLPTKGENKTRCHRRRASVVDHFSPAAALGVYSAVRKPGNLLPAHVELASITPYVWERKDRKAHIGLGLGLPSNHTLQTIPETEVLVTPAPVRDLPSTPEELPVDYLYPPVSPLPPSPAPACDLLQTVSETEVLETSKPLSTLKQSSMDYLLPPVCLLPSSPPLGRLGSSPQPQPQDTAGAPSPIQPLPSSLSCTSRRPYSYARGYRRPASQWSKRFRLSRRGRPLVSPILEEDEDAGHT